MNTHLRALFIKFFIALAVTGILLFFTGITLTGGLLIALVLTLVTYLAADIPFLPVLGREFTAVVDAVLAIPVLWSMTWLYTGIYPSAAVLVLLALIVAVGEWFFHVYAMRTGIYKFIRRRIKK